MIATPDTAPELASGITLEADFREGVERRVTTADPSDPFPEVLAESDTAG